MKVYPLFLLTLCLVIFSNVEESLARKRSEAFRRCLKQMKTSFKQCLTKLSGKSEQAPAIEQQTNHTETVQQEDRTTENETKYDVIEVVNQTSAEQRYEIMQQLQSTLMEKISKVPSGKLKIGLLERFKKELARTMKTYPKMANLSTDDPLAKLQNSLIEKLTKDIQEEDEQERMHDPKYRRKIEEQQEREKLQEEMNKMQEKLSLDLERRSKLEFTESVPNRIRIQVMNTTSLKTELATSMVDLTESRDTLEGIKRSCREIKRIYEIDVSATIDFANYLLQNVDLQIDLMTAVVRVMNRQPNLVSGTFGFDFNRAAFDRKLLRKASAEIYEMTRSFAEMRQLHYKIKDREWSYLANKTGVLFFEMNNELSRQNQRFSMSPGS